MMMIVMSGHGSIETAVQATKLGAYDYLEKPLDSEKIAILVRNALHQRKLEEENLNFRIQVERHLQLVGDSSVMNKLREQIAAAAPTHKPRSDFRRKRHGKGVGGSIHSPAKPAPSTSFCRSELRGDS